MRIITRLNVGGPAIQATRLTAALVPAGYSTRLVHGRLGTGEGDMSYRLEPGADATYMASLQRQISPLDDLRTLVRLVGELRAFRPDIVHTHTAKAGLLGRMAAAIYNSTRGSSPRARVVHTYHGHVLDGYFRPLVSRTFIALERLLARVSDELVAISPTIRQELVATYRIGRDRQYRVIPLGFDLAPFAAIDGAARQRAREALAIPADRIVVTTVGRLTPIKQPQTFLEMIATLEKRHPQIIAVIAGDGELREQLVAVARRLGIADRVRWLGWQRDLVPVYGASDVFVLTSRNEGTPVAVIEAMASGVPVVSTAVGGVGDVIDSADVGLLAPFGDVPALAAHVERLIGDAALGARLAAGGRARVLATYGIERLVRDVDTLYRDLISKS